MMSKIQRVVSQLMVTYPKSFFFISRCRLVVFITLLIVVLQGCTPLSPHEEFVVPVEHFTSPDAAAGEAPYQYTIEPRDVLDVMFRFDTVQADKYRIAPHDKLTIRFLSAPTYDDVYQVRPDGYVALPLYGDLLVKGLTVDEVQERLVRIYTGILKRPEFFITFAEFQVHLKEIQRVLDHPNMGMGRLITVRDDSWITLPIIGEVDVSGKTVEQVTVEANARYDAAVPGMAVDIMLRESQPLEVYVFGEVKSPGSHRVTAPVSLFTAIALAGGANFDARLDTVLTLQKEGNEMVGRVFNFNELLAGKGRAILLNPDDIVYVPRSRLSTAAQTMQYMSDILLFRGVDLSYTYRLDD